MIEAIGFLAKHKDTQYCSKTCKDKAWNKSHKEHSLVWHRTWKLNHPTNVEHYKEKALSPEKKKKMQEYHAQYGATHKEERRRHYRLNVHKFKTQRIARQVPLKDACEICGKKGKCRHHPDYSKPDFVITVCGSCHRKIHVGTLVLGEVILEK